MKNRARALNCKFSKRQASRIGCCAVVLGLALGFCTAAAQEQYPKPLIHTATDHPAARVLLITIDGLHAFDLANWVAVHPHSTLAELTRRGVTYTNAQSLRPDPAAGLMALVTGGTPISTGIVSSDGYDHALAALGTDCRGMGAPLLLNDGATSTLPAALDPANGCAALEPHRLLRVNTMFEVVHEKIGRTAWAGENAVTTDLLRGPSGKGLEEACLSIQDARRVDSVLHWIDGKDCSGQHDASVPVLFGLSLLTVAHAQAATGMGYSDALGTPSAGLEKAFEQTDDDIAKIVNKLKAAKLYDSTWICIVSAYGLAPTDRRQLHVIPLGKLDAVATAIKPGLDAHLSGGDVAMMWLSERAETKEVAKAFSDRAQALGIERVITGQELALTLNAPQKDTRMPDIVLEPQPGVLWGPEELAGYGGTRDEDTHVALLISGAQLPGRFDPTLVPTTQLAPLLLRALGMEKFDLQALHLEHSPALPGVF